MSLVKIKGTSGLLDRDASHGLGVDPSGPNVTVPQQLLDRPDIVIGLEQMTGEAMAEGVRYGPLGYPGLSYGLSDGLLRFRRKVSYFISRRDGIASI